MPIRPARPAELTPDYKSIAAQEAESAGLPVALVHQLIDRESKWNPKAVSPKGARGLMQLMPDTAKGLGVDPDDPVQNIRGGVKYLRQMYDQFGGDTTKALAAYNAGPGAVSKFGGIPPYQETQDYVRIVSQGQPPSVPRSTGRVPRSTGRVRPATPTEEAAGRLSSTKPATLTAGPDWGTRLSRWITPTVGAIAGGMKGAAMGAPAGPPGVFAGAVAGAGLGAGGAELLRSGFEYFVGQKPPTPSGIVRRVGSAATTGMVGEATGIGTGKVLSAAAKPLLRPFAKEVEPYAKEAISTFRRPGGASQVLPSEITRSRVLDVAENVAEGSLLGGKRLTAMQDARQQIAEEKVLGVLDTLRPRSGTKKAGESVLEGRRRAIEGFRANERTAWGEFDTAVGDAPLTATPKLDAFIAETLQKEKAAILPNAGTTAAQRVAALTGEEPAGILLGGVEQDFKSLPVSVQQALVQAGHAPPAPTMTIAQFRKTVSNLGTLTRRLDRAAKMDPTKNAELGLSKKLYGLAQDDLDEALKALGPKAVAAHENARMTSRMGNQQLFNEEIRRVAKAAPEKIVGKLLTRDNSTAITAVQRAVGPDDFAQVQSAAMQRILRANARSSSVNWGEVASRIDGLGDDTLNALFPGGHSKDVRKVASLMLDLHRKPAGSIGKMAIQFSQSGSVIGLATGTFAPASGAVLLTPIALARIFTSPTGLKWLSTGLKAPQGSREAVTAASQLAAFLGREGMLSAEDVQDSPTERGARVLADTGGPPRPSAR